LTFCSSFFGLGGVLGPTSCDVCADPAICEGAEVGLAAASGIGGSFPGLPAEVLFDLVHERNVPVLIAHALRQAVRHDDLGFCIDGGPRALALDVAAQQEPEGRRHSLVGGGSLRCERIDIAILDIKLSARIPYARKRAAVRRRRVRRGHAAVEESVLALVLRPSAATAQGETAKTDLPADSMPQSRLFGSNLHSAQVDVLLPRPTLIFGYESLESIQSASQLETEWDASDAPQRAAKRTGTEPVEDPLANKKTL
jgi:hypothetical protein